MGAAFPVVERPYDKFGECVCASLVVKAPNVDTGGRQVAMGRLGRVRDGPCRDQGSEHRKLCPGKLLMRRERHPGPPKEVSWTRKT